jgi:adenylate kinase family enzyme
MMRMAIMGNAGAGKSHLARALSVRYSVPVVSLDELFWMPPGQYTTKRPVEQLMALVSAERAKRAWAVEGVYGELIQPFLADAQCLFWLDTPWDVCRRRIITRQRQRIGQTEDASFQALLAYAAAYEVRRDARSHDGHRGMFEAFACEKWRLSSEDAVNRFLVETGRREQ